MANYYLQFVSSLPLPGGSSLKQIKQFKYFLPYPTTITFEIKDMADFNSFYINTGGIFYPPAVIISYLTLPVIKRTLSLLIFPRSPEWR